MKKIMKKALSLALALVMMLSLAPMTAMAAGTGTESDPVVLENATTTITSDATGSPVYYLYEAPVAADYEILVTGATDSFGYSMIHPMTGMPFQNYAWNGELNIYVYGTNQVAFNLFDYESQELTITITMIEGTEIGGGETGATGATPEDAITITEDEPFATVPGASMVYYKVAVEAGAEYTLSLSTKSYDAFDLYLYNPKFGQYGCFASSENNAIETTVTPSSDEYIFAIGNPNDLEMGIMVSMEKVGGEETNTNSMDAPEVITELGTYNNELPAGAFSYWYQWVATGSGVLTVTTTNEGGYAGFIVNGDWDCVTEALDNGGKVMVETGDVVVFYVSPAGASTVNMTASFEEGAVIETEEDLGGEEEANFEWGEPIVVGENALAGPADWAHLYTVHEFAPGKVGVYTFTTEDSLMGIVSTNGMWINVGNPGEEYNPDQVPELVITDKEIVWTCTDENQAIWLGVFPEMLDSNITVTWAELEVEEIPFANPLPSISLDTYSFKGEVDDLQSLMYDIADEKVTIYSDDNGYYHVVSVDDVNEAGKYVGKKPLTDCPYALVKLNDSIVSLQSAIGYGSVKYVEYSYDEDGIPHAEFIYYFNDMITEYLACADTDAKLYPLTDDLLAIMYLVGQDQGWYETDGAVEIAYRNDGVPAEVLYYFATYYANEDITTLDKEEPVVDKEAMEDIIANNKDKDTVINTVAKNEAGEEVKVTFTFAAGTMNAVEGKDEYTFEVSVVETFDKAELANTDVKKETFVIRVNFEYDGKLPGEATIYIPVPAAYINKTLYYYQVLADGTLKYVCDAPVDAAGNAKVTQDHCSDYVLLTEKIVEETPEKAPEKAPVEAPDTGDSTNFALWIAVLGLGVVAMAGSVVMKKREF